ncbi:hypothetical protein O3M35_008524 [Rhynocoris fuscipes]|uniref:Uncharacterized protein n=1 Tax=Rhynocoris fuscipes TaxID=488301 RepID=A0AAW1DBU3_9HEMI
MVSSYTDQSNAPITTKHRPFKTKFSVQSHSFLHPKPHLKHRSPHFLYFAKTQNAKLHSKHIPTRQPLIQALSHHKRPGNPSKLHWVTTISQE